MKLPSKSTPTFWCTLLLIQHTPRAIIEQNRTEHVVEYYYRVSLCPCVYVITNEYTSLEEERDKSSSNFREAAQRANKTTNL